MADFEKGTLTRLSIGSDGRLALAPVVKELFDPSVAFLWAVARDSKGQHVRGRRRFGRLEDQAVHGRSLRAKRKRLPSSKASRSRPSPSIRHDRVYAATSPDGKVYRVDAAGKSEVFYDPQAEIHLGAGVFKLGRSVRRHGRSGRDSSRDRGRRGQRVFQDRRNARAVDGHRSRTAT